MNVVVHGPDEPGDVIEQGGTPLRLPAAARRAAVAVLATLIIGLAAGYAIVGRPAPPPIPPAPTPAAGPTDAGTLNLFGLAQTGERPNRPQP